MRIPVSPTEHPRELHWLLHLGAAGLFLVALIDSSVIPLPIPGSTDLLLLWLVAHSGNPWLLALIAIAGSLLGGYTTWQIGHRGGKPALSRYVPAYLLRRTTAWMEHHPIPAVFLPAVLPPPIPLSPFIVAAGALGVPRNRFLAAFGVARCLRYSFLAWLGAVYGRHIVHVWSKTLEQWATPLVSVFVGLLLAGIGFGIWRALGLRKTDANERTANTSSEIRAKQSIDMN